MKRYILAATAALLVGVGSGAARSFAPCQIVTKASSGVISDSPRQYTITYAVTCGGGDLNTCGWEGVGRLTKNVGGTWTAVSELTTLFPGRPCGLTNTNRATKVYAVGGSGQYNLNISIVDSATGLVVDTHDYTHTFP